MDVYETKISDILASQSFLAKHPAASQMGSDLYSSAVNSVSEIILRQRFSGQYVSAATSLNFGAQSSFFLTPGSIMNGLILSCSVVLPRYTRAPDFWLLNAIDSVELIISGSSSVQSLKVNGRTQMDMIMATLDSNKLQLLRETNGFIDLQAAGATVKASIPLHLFFSSIEMESLFGCDTSTLSSQIILNIRWRNATNVFSGDSTNAIVLPTGFNDLYMRVAEQVSIDNSFALSNELRQDPNLVYSIPGTYLQSYSQVVNVSSLSTENMVNLTSMPSGALQAILCSVQEVSREGLASTQGLINPWAAFESIRLLYNGVELYRADSSEEIRLMNAAMTDKDNGINLQWINHRVTTAAATPVLFQETPVVIIPFANQVSKVLRERRSENTKSYSGGSLQFNFTIKPSFIYRDNTNPIVSTSTYANSTGDYRLNFTFINAALYEISQRSVSLNM